MVDGARFCFLRSPHRGGTNYNYDKIKDQSDNVEDKGKGKAKGEGTDSGADTGTDTNVLSWQTVDHGGARDDAVCVANPGAMAASADSGADTGYDSYDADSDADTGTYALLPS